jgi:hypothetical protein
MRRTAIGVLLPLLPRIDADGRTHRAYDHVVTPRSARRENTVAGLKVRSRGRNQGREAFEEDVGFENNVGCAVSPGIAELVEQPSSARPLQATRGEGRASDVAAQVLEPRSRVGPLGDPAQEANLTRLANRLEASRSTVSKLCRLHDQEMQRGREYSVQSAKRVHDALRGWGRV